MSLRLAPRATRIASSLRRSAERASKRLAALAVAINNTSPVANKQDRERCAIAVPDITVSLPAFDQAQARLEETLLLLRIAKTQHTGLMLHQTGVDSVQRPLGLLACHARFQACHQIDPIIVVALRAVPVGRKRPAQGYWHIDVRYVAEGDTVEALGRDSDNRECHAIHGDRLIEHFGPAVQPVLPVAVPQNRDRIPGARVIGRRDHTSDYGVDAERREVAARYQHHRPWNRLVAERQVRREPDEAGHTVDACGLFFQSAKDRVAEDKVHTTRLIGGTAAGFELAWRGHQHQFLRVRNRQRAEQYLVHQREDRRVGPDAQPQ